jgi:nucleotide-binding universal stress UspA family protein
MTGATQQSTARQPNARVPFGRILCGVDASRPSREAVRQAITLANGGGHVRFLAVTFTTGYGPTRNATLTPARAELAVSDAIELAASLGTAATAEVVSDPDPTQRLAAEATGADLLVVGTRGNSRIGGMMLGSTATTLAHETDVPLLIARHAREATPFPERIVLAHCGNEDPRLVDTAARIAAAHQAQVAVVHAGRCDRTDRQNMAVATARLQEAVGVEPIVDIYEGAAHKVVIDAARFHQASLVICGRRGVHGLRALGSVSERLAHDAPCSVLLVPR